MSATATKLLLILILLPLVWVSAIHYSLAQTTVGTGSIVGTVSDSSGAVIRAAKVVITNAATQQLVELVTNSSGSFNSGALIPGEYRARISAEGFRPADIFATVVHRVNRVLPVYSQPPWNADKGQVVIYSNRSGVEKHVMIWAQTQDVVRGIRAIVRSTEGLYVCPFSIPAG